MPCLVAAIGLIFPRLTMVLLVIFGDYLGRAYETTLWPLLGFFFAPYSTLAYAFAINHNGSLGGIHLAIFIVAVLVDLGVIGGSGHSASRSGRK
ncbi:MAG: hypothetical protein HND58_03890 [Planctomycetota bacterium]|nr:MAG: hypothetical protein HND58_03890 [Planctomycetota bacterium]